MVYNVLFSYFNMLMIPKDITGIVHKYLATDAESAELLEYLSKTQGGYEKITIPVNVYQFILTFKFFILSPLGLAQIFNLWKNFDIVTIV
jgi:hypothetical protein